jgi:hypothetical protein
VSLIKWARGALWVSCVGSLSVFAIHISGLWDTTIGPVLQALGLTSGSGIVDLAKKVPDWWHGASGVFTGVGAFIARRQHGIDKRLNATWYWVSQSEREKPGNIKTKEIIRLELGEITFFKLHKLNNAVPQDAIAGETSVATGIFVPVGFKAENIMIGGRDNRTIYYEWKYTNNAASGVSRLTYSYVKGKTFWSSLLKRRDLELHGRFMPDNGEANGTIDYYRSEIEAKRRYNNLADSTKFSPIPI